MAEPEIVRCLFCQAGPVELVSLFGSQLLLSQFRCPACRSYFEGVRDDGWDAVPVAPASTGEDDDGS